MRKEGRQVAQSKRLLKIAPLWMLLGLSNVAGLLDAHLLSWAAETMPDLVVGSVGRTGRIVGTVGSSIGYTVGGVTDLVGPVAPVPLPVSVSRWRKSTGNGEQDYEAMCLLSRRSRFSERPLALFFSAIKHSVESLGCTADGSIRFRLSPVANSDNADDQDLSETEIKGEQTKQREEIKSKLLDSGLYNVEETTYILIHGFMADWKSDNWMCNTKDLILNNTLANVFIIDWSGGSKPMMPIDYGQAVANTKYVAKTLATFLNSLIDLSGQKDASQFHLMGHSLGAHICGFVGYSFKGSMQQITGLDPAGPCFHSSSFMSSSKEDAAHSGYLSWFSTRRLSASSAKRVLSLHTDGKTFGLDENCAHYDIYIAGGQRQPFCSLLEDIADVCSHSFGHDALDSLITSSNDKDSLCHPMAYECASWGAFEKGECGLCLREDKDCVYMGIDLRPNRVAANLNQTSGRMSGSRQDNRRRRESEADQVRSSRQGRAEERTWDLVGSSHHYIKSNKDKPHCLFHYQLVVASRESSGSQNKYYFQFPLNNAYSEYEARLVEVSHLVEAGSKAYDRLNNEYLATVREEVKSSEKELLRDDKSSYYTALITFESAQIGGECDRVSSNSNQWILCEPLGKLVGAKLLSEGSQSELETVKWVAVNYMSGSDGRQRSKYSRLLAPDGVADETVEGEPKQDEHPSSVGELLYGLATSAVSSLKQPVDCLVSQSDCTNSVAQTGKWLALRPIMMKNGA